MRIALAMIVKPDDDEAIMLDTCLENVSPHVDGIFITITGNNKEVERVAQKYKAIISHYEWDKNFARARNYSFAQVPKEYDYIMWCDADDVFRGLEKLKPTMEEHPADAYAMFYLYAFDEYKNPIVVHQKTMVVRNDGCVEWNEMAFLHEDFKENRKITIFFLKGIERIHLSTPEKFELAAQRNVEVATKQLEELPDDPRSYWNAGNSFSAVGKHKEAIKYFDLFMKKSESDEEKYIVHLRKAENLHKLGQKIDSYDELRYAIGLRPDYPDAYNLMGTLYLADGLYEKAIDYIKQGLVKEPPYYKIIVYNPRDYDYVPLMNLAKAYFAINLPTLALECMKACLLITPKDTKLKELVDAMEKEANQFEEISKKAEELHKITDKKKLWRELDKIPDDFKAHPLICKIRNLNFVKDTASGKDIAIFCGFTSEEWTPETALTKGIGGSEEAVIHLSKRFAKKGYNVEVYNNCGHQIQEYDGVTYKPFWMWNYRDKQNVVIIWRHPRPLDFDINADQIVLDMHDVIPNGEFTEARVKKIDKIFVKSNFHRSLYPEIPDDKFVIIPNGIESHLFEPKDKDEMLLINTSSPDRSLSSLIEGFKLVKKEVPQAKCKWAYGWGVFDATHSNNQVLLKWKDDIIRGLDEVGIENLGRLSHPEVNKLYNKAKILAYPSEFAEIDCISLSKAQAGGAIPVTSDFSALGEKQEAGGVFIHSDKNKDTWCLPYQYDFALDMGKVEEWANAVIKILKGKTKIDINKMSQTAKERYDWDTITDLWISQLIHLKP